MATFVTGAQPFLRFVSTEKDVVDESASIIHEINLDKRRVVLRGLTAGPGIKIKVVDADQRPETEGTSVQIELDAALGGGSVTSVDIAATTAGITVGGGPITTSGTLQVGLDAKLVSLAGIGGPGLVVWTGGSFVPRTLTSPSGTIVIGSGSGVAGNPSLDLEVTGVTPGTWSKVTVDAYGRVTSGTIVTSSDISPFVSDVDAGGFRLTNLGTPVAAADAVTKGYADALAGGLVWKESVVAKDTAAADSAGWTYNAANEPSGLIWTGLANPLVLDGRTIADGERILITESSDQRGRGIFTYDAVQNALRRAPDADNVGGSEVFGGMSVFVTGGSTQALSGWAIVSPSGSVTLGTDNIQFTQISASVAYTASNGVQIVGNDIRLAGQALTFHNLADTGFVVRSGSGVSGRTIVGAAGRIVVTNGDGVAGNPTLDLDVTSVTPGSYGSSTEIPVPTVDQYGRITSITTVPVSIGGGTITLGVDTDGNYVAGIVGTAGQIEVTNGVGEGVTATIALAPTGVTTGTWTKVTVDAQGRVTSAAVAALDELAAPGGNLSIGNQRLVDVAAPVAASDAATKGYVDAVAAGAIWKQNVLVKDASSAESASWVYQQANDGTPGLPVWSNVVNPTLDGVVVPDGARVLITEASDKRGTGVFTYSQAQQALIRASDLDTSSEIVAGITVFVDSGSTGGDTVWTMYSPTGTVTPGTSQMLWTQTGSAQPFTASNGVQLVGTDFQLAGVARTIHDLGTTGILVLTGGTNAATRSVVGTAGRTVVTGGNGVSGDIVVDLDASGVAAGVYGSGTQVPRITVDSYGRITGIVTEAVNLSGVQLGVDTVGNYVAGVAAGTGITVTNGSGVGVTATVGLSNTGVVPGDWTRVTVDAQGRVTAGAVARLSDLLPATADIDLGGYRIVNLAGPSASTDAATKSYVDAIASGLVWKPAVAVKDTAAADSATWTYNQANEPSGQIWTGLASPLVLDGYAVPDGSRVLIAHSTDGRGHGIFVYDAATNSLSRAPDADSSAEYPAGTSVFVVNGLQYGGTGWSMYEPSAGSPTLGTDSLLFTQTSSSPQYTAANGVVLTGSIFELGDLPRALYDTTTSGIPAVDGVARTIVTRSIQGSAGRVAVTNGDGLSGNPTIDLVASGVVAGSYTKVTVDTYGRVTAGASASLSELSSPVADLSMGGYRIVNLGAPSVATDAATKGYVDALTNGLIWKPAVVAKDTSSADTAGWTYNPANEGTAGAPIWTGVTAAPVLDGVTLADGDRLLITEAADARGNGIFVYDDAQNALVRASDADNVGGTEVEGGISVFVLQGSTMGGTGWALYSPSGAATLGTDGLLWTQINASTTYTASSGIKLVGSEFQLDGIARSIHDLGTNGILVRTGGTTAATRTVTGTAGRIVVTNGDGVAGNPTLDLATSGVTPGVYGSATTVPQVTVDAYGRVTNVTEVVISGGGGGGGQHKVARTVWSGGTVSSGEVTLTGIFGSDTPDVQSLIVSMNGVMLAYDTNAAVREYYIDGASPSDLKIVVDNLSVPVENGDVFFVSWIP